MANNTKETKKRFSIVEYFREIKIELRKVVWPTSSELLSYTGVVVGTCAAFALVFWAADSVCAVALQKLLGVTITM
ncbi:MAG: preprotein translocase subunit SecE [Clostridia bacterium]|nr:preprotein translocase subunit SecE [Clostridia bacterium]